MLCHRCCIGARRIRRHNPGSLQRAKIEIVVANTHALDEAHTRQEGNQASIHFPVDHQQNLGLRSIPRKVLLAIRRHNIKGCSRRKKRSKALDKSSRERIDQ